MPPLTVLGSHGAFATGALQPRQGMCQPYRAEIAIAHSANVFRKMLKALASEACDHSESRYSHVDCCWSRFDGAIAFRTGGGKAEDYF